MVLYREYTRVRDNDCTAHGQAHTMVFTHIAPFVHSTSEPKTQYNYAPAIRDPIVKQLKDAGVSKWFCQPWALKSFSHDHAYILYKGTPKEVHRVVRK